ncbi:MAG: diaminopimelate epimerase [Lachnospiraceae bacterium]|nr:diaminopimelate epimerase [Lachnospiraceae bacterium]
MKFTKMHGCGNDYVYINGFEEQVSNRSEVAVKVSDRHFGIGGDGAIFINPSDNADFEMEMYNADGTRAEMCGNGIRCVAKYVYDKGLTDKKTLSIESFGKIKYIDLTVADGKVTMVKVNMGSPELRAAYIPVDLTKIAAGDEAETVTVINSDMNEIEESGKVNQSDTEQTVLNVPITVAGKEYRMTAVSMGNPHAVIFVDDVANFELEKIGPLFEHHPCFPKRVNVEFVKIIDRKNVEMRVWERGTGETLACGTGCCATVAACILNGLTDSEVTVKLLGGRLTIQWDREQNLIYMTGPATTVFDGEIEV